MEITRQADYAVRAMVHVGRLPPGSRVSTATISEAEKIPLPFLTKVIAHLVRSGLVTTNRGMGGGVSVARSPQQITLLEILEAIEGPILLNRCLQREGMCEIEHRCPVHDVWAKIQHSLVKQLGSVTVSELVHKQVEKEQP
jgi:Rrf2 family protein